MIKGASKVWKPKVGLEIHAQISAVSKLFSAAPGRYSGSDLPNTRVSLFDAAIPGTLPQLNRVAVQQAIRASSAFNCRINKKSYFERKHYFYQDLPLGYQITQEKLPIAQNGSFEFDVVEKGKFLYKTRIGIERIQVEQDSGKSLHDVSDLYTLVDLNRAGVGLLEIVFAPDLSSPVEASSCLRAIQKLLRHLGICDGNMQDGSMRCDVNISVCEHRDSLPLKSVSGNDDSSGSNHLIQGARVEVKNINSMNMVESAAESEIRRHVSLLEEGAVVARETRAYNDSTQETMPLRAKETAVDYRIFPDPDIPFLLLTDNDIAEAKASMMGFSELPEVTLANISNSYKLDLIKAESLLSHPGALPYFEKACKINDEYAEEKRVSNVEIYNWMLGDLLANLNFNYFTFENSPVEPNQLHALILLVSSKVISALQAKKVMKCLFENENFGADPNSIIDDLGLRQVSDESYLLPIIEEAISDPNNKKKLNTFLTIPKKRDRMTNFFFGEVMKKSKGQANPLEVKKLLAEALERTLQKSE